MIAAAITRGQIEICGAEASHLTSVIELLRETGVGIRYYGELAETDVLLAAPVNLRRELTRRIQRANAPGSGR